MSLKKSDFLGQTSVLPSDTFDFVRSGTNFKISFSNFAVALGVTGTLSQSVAGTPVLDGASPDYIVRNIEGGPGVKTQISPQNGVQVSHNFLFDTSGVSLVDDPNLLQPTLPSFIPGDGVSISKAGNQIQISATGETLSTKTVTVTQLSDLPAPVSGNINLEAATVYQFLNDVNIGDNSLVLGQDTVIRGANVAVITITATGNGDAIVANDVDFRIEDITINHASGRVINANDTTNTKAFGLFRLTAVCATFGNFGNYNIGQLDNCSLTYSADGIYFTGDMQAVGIFQCVGIGAAGSFVDFNGATLDGFALSNSVFFLSPGAVGLTGQSNSANIAANGLGTVSFCRFNGTGTPLSGLSVEDARWQYLGNDDIADTRPDALIFMQNNATATTVSAPNTPVSIAGTFSVESDSQMTGDANGRITYNGERAAKLPIDFSISVAPVSGGDRVMNVYLAVNGVVVPGSKRTGTTGSGDPISITGVWQRDFAANDYVEIWVENADNSVDLIVTSAIFRVN